MNEDEVVWSEMESSHNLLTAPCESDVLHLPRSVQLLRSFAPANGFANLCNSGSFHGHCEIWGLRTKTGHIISDLFCIHHGQKLVKGH